MHTAAPNTRQKSPSGLDRTKQVVALQLSYLAMILQPCLLCYPVGYRVQVHRGLFAIFFLIMWASVEPDSPGLTQATGR